MSIPERTDFHNFLVDLYAEFQADVIAANKNYTDADLGFSEFMTWLIRNNP